MALYFSSPYSQEKDLGKAYNDFMKLLQPEDYVCFIDLDSLFLTSDIGDQLQEIIAINPTVGLFTSYCNRVGNLNQCFNRTISEDPNILNHKAIALQLQKENRHTIKPIINPISGMLMLFKKSTWEAVGGFPEQRGILTVDNTFSNRIVRHGYSLMLMEGVYLFHYYRFGNIHDKSHLKKA